MSILTLLGVGSGTYPTAASSGAGAVTFDSASADVFLTTSQSISVSHTAAGSNRGAFVFAYARSAFAAFIDGSATYGSTAATMTRLVQSAPDAQNYYAAFAMAAPATGAQTVTVNFTAEDCDSRGIVVITANGVHQTTPVGTSVTETSTGGTTPSLTVASLATGGMVVDGITAWEAVGGSTLAVGANQTRVAISSTVPGAFLFQTAGSRQDSADGGVMSWTKDAALDYYHIGVEFKPA